MRHVANNLPSIPKPEDTEEEKKKKEGEKQAGIIYVGAITTFTNALLEKANTWIPEDKYPKLYAERDAVLKRLNAVNTNPPDNLTKENVMSLADAFDKLYARLRMMEAEKVNQFIQSKFKSYNKFRPNFINDELVIKETAADLKNENITTPADIDKVEKSEDLLLEEDNEIEQIGLVDKDNIATLVSEGQLTKVTGQEGVYSSNAIYCNDDGDIVSKTANGKKLFITKYYKLVDDKLVPAKKTAEGKYVPYTTTQVTSSEIKTYNDEIARVQKLADDEKIIRVKSVGAIIPKVPLFKAAASDDYFVWRKGELVRIKNVKSVTSSNGAIHVKVEGAKSSVTLEKLMEDGDNFETFSDEELKTVKQVEEEKAQKAKDEANQKRANAYKEAHPHAEDINDFNKKYKDDDKEDIEIYKKLNYNECVRLGIKELKVKGWFVTTSGEKTYYKYKDKKLKEMKHIKEIYDDGTCVCIDGKKKICPQYGDPKKFAVELQDALAGDTDKENENRAFRILRTFINYKEPEDIISFLEAYEDERTIVQDSLCTQLIGEWGNFNNEMTYEGKTMLYKEFFMGKIAEKVLLSVIGNIKDIEISDDDKDFLENLINVEIGWFGRNVTKSTAMKLDYIIKDVVKQYRELQAENKNQDQSK